MLIKDFTFQVARLRTQEESFLSNGHIERMISAKNSDDAFRVLYDTQWAEFIAESYNPENFGQVLDAGLLHIKNDILEMLEYDGYFDFVWLLFDLQNTKILTKAKLKGENPDNIRYLLSDLGVFSRTHMERVVYDKQKTFQTDFEKITFGEKPLTKNEKFCNSICDLIIEIEDLYKKNPDPILIDNILNKFFIDNILIKAKKTKSYIIKSFFGRMVDIENIKLFLRYHNYDPDYKSKLENTLIDGGKIEKHFFLEINSVKELLSHIKFFHIYKMVRDHILEENLDFIQIEKSFDEILYKTLQPSKIEAFGPEPVFAYFWTKRRNAEIIRAVMTGKLNNVDEKTIRKWVKIPSLPLV